METARDIIKVKKLKIILGLIFIFIGLYDAQTQESKSIVQTTKPPVRVIKVNRHKHGLLGLLPSMVDDYDYTVSYFQNPDLVDLYGSISLSELRMGLFFSNAGKKLQKPVSISLQIFVFEGKKGCVYENVRQLSFNLDDNLPESIIEIKSGIISVYEDRNFGVCDQSFTGRMNYELFNKIASAKKVKVTIGPKTIDFSKKSLKTIREINKAVGIY